jgi:hypothetical protein
MAISDREAAAILKLAHDAGIEDGLIEDWTDAAGAYRYALTSKSAGNPKAQAATEIRARINKYIADREHTVVAEAARAAGINPPPTPGNAATPAQVDYIMSLLARRIETGEGGGFFQGPTTRESVQQLTKADASNYIKSLKGEY